MFSPAPTPRTRRSSWAATVRRACDVLVAFATLEDGSERPPEDGGAPEAAEALAHEHLAGRHPHRTPLRPAPRAGRPGTVLARPQSCSPAAERPRAGETRPLWDLT